MASSRCSEPSAIDRTLGHSVGEGRPLARIWTGGRIIRAALLDTLRAAWMEHPDLEHLLLVPVIATAIGERMAALRATVAAAQSRGIPVPALSASLARAESTSCA